MKAEDAVIFSGIGQSDVGRRLDRDELDLTLQACLGAIEDAGLTRADIDGLTSYPGGMMGTSGFAGPGTPEVQDALQLDLNFHRAGPEGAAQFSAIVDAILAVAGGLAKHVLVYRTVTEATVQGSKSRQGLNMSVGKRGVGGWMQWLLPAHAYSAVNWAALYAARYMHEFGMTESQLAHIALNGRANASLNPNAVYREPMSLDDYLGVRMISTPLRLYDCDVPCDGSTAFVISHRDYATDAPQPSVAVASLGTAITGRPWWDQRLDFTTMAAHDAAAMMWSRTDLAPADVDAALLYDGFSILTIFWLEALGFCERGGAGEFVASGAIQRDGSLPVNTHGGQLSAGRLHGFGFVHEAITQLRGEGGDRQLPTRPEVAVAAAGGGPLAGCLLLTRPR